MSGYHRLGGYSSHEQDDQDPFHNPPPMDQRYHDRSPSPIPHPGLDPRYTGHSPSPGPPFHPQGYQPHDRPPPVPLEIPVGPGPGRATPSDQLASQPTYSVENIPHSYGHKQHYRESHPVSPPYDPHQATGDLSLHPEDHHNAYYNDPYAPTPSHEDPFHVQTDYNAGWHDERDDRPILGTDHTHGPDPYQDAVPDDVIDTSSGFMTAAGEPKPAPAPVEPKRWKTVKEIQLFEGNLVLDCPIPPRLLNQVPHADPPERDEYTHMRYSAVTGDPSEFFQNRFRLRQQLFAKPRHTELFICITMYNEEDELFARTLSGVIKNIEYMNNRKTSKTWGQEAWKKIVVCVVSDGRAKINPRTRAVLAALGCYQDGIAKQNVNGKDVTAHVYEYTTQMNVEIKKNVVNIKKGNTPVQMIFCLKEKNQKKINSHRWFFQAFGSVLNPVICCLIDAGTRPGKDSIYNLWKAFDIEPKCAGACGEIRAMLEHGKALINPLVAAQNFEYKMSNILDKPLESVFGFITVLPGAFSAYRYVALQNDKTGQGPLEKYFKGETLHGADAGLFTSNMYLAEDRILCFELVAKRNSSWVLQYVKSSEGVTDVPTEVADFIMQRRRWLNGSFFAAVYATFHFYQIFRSSHSCIRKVMFLLEFLYQFINQLFAWFAIGNFFLVFRILTVSLGDPTLLGATGRILAVIFEWLYMITLVSCFILALGNRPQGSRRFYFTMVCFWVVLMVYLTFAAVFVVVKSIQQTVDSAHGHFTAQVLFSNKEFNTLIVSLFSTYLLYFTMSFLFLDPWHMFTSFIQYMMLTPMYINILNVYAFCNIHDITWGTKGADTAPKLDNVSANANNAVNVNLPTDDADLNTQYEAELRTFATKFVAEKKKASKDESQEDYYKGFRSAVVLIWMFCNLGLAAAVLATGGFERLETSSPKATASAAPTSRLLTRQNGGSNSGSNSGSGSSGRSSSSSSGGDTLTGGSTGDSTLVDRNSLIYMQVVLYSVAVLSGIRWIGSLWFLILRLIRGV